MQNHKEHGAEQHDSSEATQEQSLDKSALALSAKAPSFVQLAEFASWVVGKACYLGIRNERPSERRY